MPSSTAPRWARLVTLLLLACGCFAARAEERSLPVRTIGVVFDGQAPDDEPVLLLAERRQMLVAVQRELRGLAAADFDVRFPADKRATGDWTLAGIRAAIGSLMGDPEVDIVLALGVFASNEVCRRETLAKPVVAPWALDTAAQALPKRGVGSGRHNLNYVISPGSIVRDLRKFNEIHPMSTVHLLVDSLFLEAIPEVPGIVVAGARAAGLEIVTVPVDLSADEALGRLPEDVEGVYVTPFLRMPSSELDRVVAGLIERRIPSFSLLGRVDVERGVMAGTRTRTDAPRLARRVALNMHRILLGEDAGTLPVVLDQEQRLSINISTAEAIGFYPRWRTLIEADLVDDRRREAGRTLSLSTAVHEAVQANLALQVVERRIASGAEEIRRSRSQLRPRVDSFISGLSIDEDRAEASFGSQAERTVSAGLRASQTIFSDRARAGVTIAERLQASLEQDREIARLDVALAASTALLNVLRAETLYRVELDNLRLTDSNLELARGREEIGQSGPADVYRWESLLASNRSAVLTARSQVDRARIVLNQLRHRPLEEPFSIEAPALAQPDIVSGFGRLRPYIENARSLRLFREFSVGEGLGNTPELRSIDEAIQARERMLTAARRSYWSPEVSVRAEVGRRLSRDGAGSQGGGLPGGAVTPTQDRDDWSVEFLANLPLSAGGARKAELRQAREELEQLRLERRLLAEQVELRIRAAMFAAGSTYPAIGLSREAANAARKNLDLVRDAYSQGALSIIDLIDAQNAALVAESSAANAIYEFLIDLMEIQRATNTFDFFRSAEGRNAWFERLEAFFEAADEHEWLLNTR